jgi:phenylacetate-CoA ligase
MTRTERIYSVLPVWAQHIATTLEGIRFRTTRYSGAFPETLAFLRKMEFAPASTLRDLQTQELRRLIQFVGESSPYYRRLLAEHGVKWTDIETAGDLCRIPVTEKETLRNYPETFRANSETRWPLIKWNTSGTTGSPLTLYFTRESIQTTFAFIESYRNQAGVDRRARRGQFTGKVVVPPRSGASGRCFWRRDLANNTVLLSTMHLLPANLPAYADCLRNFQPEYLSGYPSAMYVLAQHFKYSGQPAPQLKAALTSAETLLDHQREAIEEVFGTHVFDQYGQCEMQAFWYECPAGRLHAHPLFGISEILLPNGEPAPLGEFGDVVVTGFQNYAMPLIRYRVGDVAAFSGETCPCGRGMPVIKKVLGRQDDYVFTRERGFLGRLDPVFKGVEHIIESQIVQENLDLIRVLYVAAPAITPKDLERLRANMRRRTGDSISIEFQEVGSIPRTARGKLRAVTSNLPLALQQGMFADSLSDLKRGIPGRST